MTAEIITWLEGEIARLKGTATVKAVETDAKAAGTAALAYIENNGLKDLYTIAVSVLTGAATGTAPETIAATVLSQGEAAGIAIAKGAEAVVIAQAQADLAASALAATPTPAPAAA